MAAEKTPDVLFEKSEPVTVAQLAIDNLRVYHEHAAGRLVVDPKRAREEFGDDVADHLKLSQDGKSVLWPQPFDDPRDPQNWSDSQKNLQLIVLTISSVISEFYFGIGVAGLGDIAHTFNVSRDEVTRLTGSWSVFLLGWGGPFAVLAVQKSGRLPILFWSQVIGLGFLIGCALAPDIETYAAMRCLCSFFSAAPHVIGLFVINDIFPFHLLARKLNIWIMGVIVSPFIPPFALGYLVSRAGFRVAYGVGIGYGGAALVLTMLFARETYIDRRNPSAPQLVPGEDFSSRAKALIGITGPMMTAQRFSLKEDFVRMLQLVWRPHLLGAMIYEGVLFGFSIGMNLTSAIFLGEPAPLGYAYNQDTISTFYLTPVVAVILGQIIGRYVNDIIAARSISRNKGVFEAESRLWTCALTLPIYVVGLVVSGAAFQFKLSPGAVVMGWAIRELAVMTNTVAVYAYANDCFPRYPGEVSALLNLFRTLGGFAVPYFQTSWARQHGALQVFGCEAAIVTGLFFLCVVPVWWYGQKLRARYSM